MDPDAAATPRDIANEVEALVITLPQSTMMLLFEMAIDQGNGNLSEAAYDLTLQKKALRYLKDEFSSKFEAAAGELKGDLTTNSTNLSEALGTLIDSIEAGLQDINIASLRELAKQANQGLTALVGAFLQSLFTQVVEFEKASAKRAQDLDADSLAKIDSISRQITFIAINASVEAARVGPVGRGFSVIASEIKSLSEDAKTAINDLRSEMS